MSKNLCIAVRRQYFEEIQSGEKKDEFRLVTDYWRKRLKGRSYDTITITLGYPPKTNKERRITFRWDGYKTKIHNHPEFGDDDVAVYAISLRGKRL